jgi:hypothetical protein
MEESIDSIIRVQRIRELRATLAVKYCDVFGRMPPLLCNRKLDTSAVAMQPKVKHLHGYATVVLHSNQQWEGRVFLLGQPDIIKGRQ